jgi:hypothetical protein
MDQLGQIDALLSHYSKVAVAELPVSESIELELS